jgi:hypothetical protein
VICNLSEPICKSVQDAGNAAIAIDLISTKMHGSGEVVVAEGIACNGETRGSLETEQVGKTACDTASDEVDVRCEKPFAEVDEEAAELLGDEMAALWMNGALIRQVCVVHLST